MTKALLTRPLRGRCPLAVLAAFVLVLATAAPASAGGVVFTATKETDSADGTCSPADCSLREAIIAANADPALDTVSVPAGSYRLTIPNTGVETSFLNDPTTGDLDVLQDTTITGAGARSTSIVAAPTLNDRVLDVPGLFLGDPPEGELMPSEANVDVSGVTIADGDTGGFGGGIFNLGTLSLSEVVLRDNTAFDSGGGIRNDFNLTIDRSTLTGNVVETEDGQGGFGGGGGLFNNDSATVTNSTFSGNRAGTFGGGMTSFGAGAQIEASYSTFNANSAPSGANIANGDVPVGPPELTPQGGGGPAVGATQLEGVIASNPRGGGANCAGVIDPDGFNLEFPGDSCGFEVRANPLLGALGDYGGQTDTHPLRMGSPAIDRAGAGACPPPATDQRGVDRPQGVRCDIGAFERILFSDLSIVKTVNPREVTEGDHVTFTLTVRNNGPDTARNVEIVDTLPSGVTFVSASPSCSRAGRTVTCQVGDLDVGESATRRIVVRADRAGRVTNSASVRSDTGDANPSNSTDSDSFDAAAACTITGTDDNDILRGTPGPDVICGLAGNDILYGLEGDDELRGGADNDVLRGGPGNDRMTGNGGNDEIVGGDGDDSLDGGPGDDVLTGQGGSDRLETRDGVRGNDVANGGPGSDSCATDAEDERTSC